MGPTACPVVAVSVTVLAVAVGVYLGWPSPKFSSNLHQWKITDSSYFTLKGKRIFYKDSAGEDRLGSSTTLLLLHGFPTMSYDWIKIWPTMTQQFSRVIAVDFLGFGFSDKPMGYHYTIMEQADLVMALLRVLKVEDFHMLAHDYGDSVAQEILARQKEDKSKQLKSTCLLNGGMFKETNFPRPVQRLLVGNPLAGKILSRLSNRYIFGAGLADVFGNNSKPAEEEMDDFWCGYRYQDGYLNSAELLGYIAERAVNNIRWRQALQHSTVPVHVIYGPADPVNPAGFIDFYKKEVPRGTIDVLADDIGHYPQWEDSENVAKLYLKFVQTTLGATST